MLRQGIPYHNEPLSRREFLALVRAEKRAREDGQRNRAESGAPDVQRDVAEILKERIGQRRSELLEDELMLRDLCTTLTEKAKRSAGEGLSGGVRDKILGLFQKLEGVIRQTMGAYRQSEGELKAFRLKHGLLERAASYPLSRIQHYGFVGVLGLGEAGFNAVMTVAGSETGWAGALLGSIGVAVLNMGISGVVGLCFRYINLPEVDHE